MKRQGQNALVFGATGATGADIVSILCKSPKWAKVHCVVRRELEEWKTIEGREKLVIERHDDLDEYFKLSNDKYGDIHSLFCCFGTQVKVGEENFRKIDKTYPLLAADIALKNKIPHYLLVSSSGSNENSCLLYLKVKGELQRDLKLKNLPALSIFKPGLLKNRRDARFGEKLGKIFFCFPSIQAIDASEVLTIVAERTYERGIPKAGTVEIYENSDMEQIIDQKRK